MINRRMFLSAISAGMAALALTGCQIDTRTPMRVSEIMAVAQSGIAVPVNTTITGQFVTAPWCKDEGAMSVETISTPNVPLQLVNCAPAGNGAVGTFQLATNMIRTDGGQTDDVILTNVLEGDTARFAVFPHGKHKHLLSVGLFLNLPALNAAKDKLVAMPVFKRGGYDGTTNFTFTIDIMNDTDKPAQFYLADVSAGGDLPSDEAIMTIPPGGQDTVTLAAPTQAKLATTGWVNFMSMMLK